MNRMMLKRLRFPFLFVVFCFFIFSTCRLVAYYSNWFTNEIWKPRVFCDQALYDFGKIFVQSNKSTSNNYPSHEFIVWNKGSRDLLIYNVVAGCGSCVEVEGFTKTAIAPNNSGSVKLKLLTDELSGKVAKEVLVKTNDPKNQNLILTLEAEITNEQTEQKQPPDSRK
jgi:hypothetical protein